MDESSPVMPDPTDRLQDAWRDTIALFEALEDGRHDDARVILRNVVDPQALIACLARAAEAFLSLLPKEDRAAIISDLRELPPPSF